MLAYVFDIVDESAGVGERRLMNTENYRGLNGEDVNLLVPCVFLKISDCPHRTRWKPTIRFVAETCLSRIISLCNLLKGFYKRRMLCLKRGRGNKGTRKSAYRDFRDLWISLALH